MQVAAVPWESVGARQQMAATITISFSCSRDTGGVDVGCSAGNIEALCPRHHTRCMRCVVTEVPPQVLKDVELAMDRMVEATIIVSVDPSGAPSRPLQLAMTSHP